MSEAAQMKCPGVWAVHPHPGPTFHLHVFMFPFAALLGDTLFRAITCPEFWAFSALHGAEGITYLPEVEEALAAYLDPISTYPKLHSRC